NIAKRRVHHDHALLAGRNLVDIIGANPGARDHLDLMRIRKDSLGTFGGRADGEPVIIADHLGKAVLIFAKVRPEIHSDTAISENLHGGFTEGVGYKHFESHFSASFGKCDREGQGGGPERPTLSLQRY